MQQTAGARSIAATGTDANAKAKMCRAKHATNSHRLLAAPLRIARAAAAAAAVPDQHSQVQAQQVDPGLEAFKTLVADRRFLCTQCGKCCTGRQYQLIPSATLGFWEHCFPSCTAAPNTTGKLRRVQEPC
jgi:hypothetical protein